VSVTTRAYWSGIALATAAWLAVCFFVRVRYVQAEHLVAYCVDEPRALVCAFREVMGKAMHFNVLGYASLAVALPALLLPGRTGRAVAGAGVLAAAAALVFYNAGLGAPAAVLALLRLARS
jgi:hypothetical protein